MKKKRILPVLLICIAICMTLLIPMALAGNITSVALTVNGEAITDSTTYKVYLSTNSTYSAGTSTELTYKEGTGEQAGSFTKPEGNSTSYAYVHVLKGESVVYSGTGDTAMTLNLYGQMVDEP